MIIKPIIPIWLITIICIVYMAIIIWNRPVFDKISKKDKERTTRQKKILKNYLVDITIKILVVILLFIINLRFMLPNGEATAISSNLNVLLVIDRSLSMRALDYNGNKERITGVIKDCNYIVDELSGCKFSMITFGNTAQRIMPFTDDVDMIKAEISSLQVEDDFYAKGTSINMVKDVLYKTLKDEKERKNEDIKTVLFFISDGEITKENEKLEAFSSIKQYVSDGAVLGYGTVDGGKMISSTYEDSPNSEFYYVYYYDDKYNMKTAISKLDEENMKKIANDIGIEYVQMSKTSNIQSKIKEIKKLMENMQNKEEIVESYRDIYYFFAIPLLILLIIDFIIKRKKYKSFK